MPPPIQQLITDHYQTLMKTFSLFIARAHLADCYTAAELLNEVTIEALKHPDRFNEVSEPLAWLIGIGANLIHRKRRSIYYQNHREVQMPDLEIFEFFNQHLVIVNPAHAVEARLMVDQLLSLLTPADREVIELAVLHDLDSNLIGRQLGIKPGTARMRLYRALKRLRTAMKERAIYE